MRALWLPLLAAWLAACGPSGPRPVRGPDAKPIAAAVPPGRLVVAEHAHRGGRLILIDERGRRVRELTAPPSTPSVDAQPAFSADGRLVAFASSRERKGSDKTAIWIVGTDGDDDGVPSRLTDDSATDITPAFAPDGRSLAFASTRGGTLDLWLLELEPQPSGPPRAGRLTQLTDAAGAELHPAFSHDGKLLAYTAAEKPGERAVLLRDQASGATQKLVAGEMPAFSPDDRSVAYAAAAPGRGDEDLWLIAVAGGAPRRLDDEPLADETLPRFSRDGRFVFATAIVRGDDRRAVLATVVFLEADDPSAGLRALQEPIPTSRNGADVAPVALDAAALRSNPRYSDAIRQALIQ